MTGVTRYVGAGTPKISIGENGSFVFYSQARPNVGDRYVPLFDPKAPLPHTVVITPTGVSGTAGSDSISAPGVKSFLFFNQQGPSFTTSITGANVSVEFVMDQGIP